MEWSLPNARIQANALAHKYISTSYVQFTVKKKTNKPKRARENEKKAAHVSGKQRTYDGMSERDGRQN